MIIIVICRSICVRFDVTYIELATLIPEDTRDFHLRGGWDRVFETKIRSYLPDCRLHNKSSEVKSTNGLLIRGYAYCNEHCKGVLVFTFTDNIVSF